MLFHAGALMLANKFGLLSRVNEFPVCQAVRSRLAAVSARLLAEGWCPSYLQAEKCLLT